MHRQALLFIAVLALPLFARENPFFPVSGSSVPNYSTNQVEKPKPFRSVSIKLPGSVRILKSVTLTCENLDGSISTKEIPINRAIDWHDNIVISEQKRDTPKQACAAKAKTSKHFKKIGSLRFVSFYVFDHELKIVTKDRLLRKFKLVKPDRIVLDFKRDSDFRTFVFKGSGIFKKITLGNHDGYYRAVIELDGRYIYHVHPLNRGYLLSLE